MSARKVQNPTFLLMVEGLSVSYDGFTAVNDRSFCVEPDARRVTIGPNGAVEEMNRGFNGCFSRKTAAGS